MYLVFSSLKPVHLLLPYTVQNSPILIAQAPPPRPTLRRVLEVVLGHTTHQLAHPHLLATRPLVCMCVCCACMCICVIFRVGQNHIYLYTVYIQCFQQGNYRTYGHIRCIYTVLASPSLFMSTVCACRSQLHALMCVCVLCLPLGCS